MEFAILGPTALAVEGRDVPLGTTKQRGLLALLLFHVGTPVRIETIVEHLWDRRPGEDYRPSLYALASRIRAPSKPWAGRRFWYGYTAPVRIDWIVRRTPLTTIV
jgi:DNA-binding SARP family transcriptional activator